jgi:hypothetical protein
LVFVTKYRHRIFNDAHLKRMEEIMLAVCADFECELVEFNGENNHVHLLVNFPPKAGAVQAGQLPQGRQLAQAPPGVPGTGPALLAGTAPVVRLVIRRIGGRRSAFDRPSVHRAAESSALTCRSEHFSESLHHRAEARW